MSEEEVDKPESPHQGPPPREVRERPEAEAGAEAAPVAAPQMAGGASSWPLMIAMAVGGFAAVCICVGLVGGLIAYHFLAKQRVDIEPPQVVYQVAPPQPEPPELPIAPDPPVATEPAGVPDDPEPPTPPAERTSDAPAEPPEEPDAVTEATAPEAGTATEEPDPDDTGDFIHPFAADPPLDVEPGPEPTVPDASESDDEGDSSASAGDELDRLFGIPPAKEGEDEGPAAKPTTEDKGLVDLFGNPPDGLARIDPDEDVKVPEIDPPDMSAEGAGEDGGETAGEDETPPPDPFEVIDREQGLLALPRRDPELPESYEPATVGILIVDDPTRCELQLLGTRAAVRDDQQLIVNPFDEGGRRNWSVLVQTENALKPVEVGTFGLEDKTLSFQWSRKAPAAITLEYCLAKLTVDDEHRVCRLAKPVRVEPLPIDFDDAKQVAHRALPAALGPTPQRLWDAGELKLEFAPDGFPPHTVARSASADRDSGDTPITQVVLKLGRGLLTPDRNVLDIALRGAVFDNAIAFQILKSYDAPVPDRSGGFEARRVNAQWDGPSESHAINRLLFACSAQVKAADKLSDEVRRLEQDLKKLQAQKAKEAKIRAEDLADDILLRMRFQKERETVMRNLQTAIDSKQESLDEVERQLQAGENLTRLAAAQQNRCLRIRMLFSELERRGAIHFRLYREVEGEQIDLIQTKGT